MARTSSAASLPLQPADAIAPDWIAVQLTLRPPDGRTKYVDQLVDGAADGVELRYFSWRSALSGSYDVFHAHWPELMIRGSSAAKRFAQRRAMQILRLRLRLLRVPIVRTVHNLAPHEVGSAAERRALAAFDRSTTLFIALNPTTKAPTSAPLARIPHGHYLHRFSDFPHAEPVSGRILYFGIIREYKGVDRLLDVFRDVSDDRLTLRVVGSPSRGQAEMVADRLALDPRASARLAYVDDEELVDEVTRAELVVLPYREMHNSGSVLVALSLGRPSLVPRSPTNTALSAEVGAGWIIQYDGELEARHIVDAIDQVRALPIESRPDLGGRDWSVIGEQHRAAYRRAIQMVRGRS
ncbi:glycosyltransferase [Glaciibacter flavus]|uniref:glycosyltransferase n=1 Tax=Orlajensenia flava TaxID=2565934 RepID=UPI003B00787F